MVSLNCLNCYIFMDDAHNHKKYIEPEKKGKVESAFLHCKLSSKELFNVEIPST